MLNRNKIHKKDNYLENEDTENLSFAIFKIIILKSRELIKIIFIISQIIMKIESYNYVLFKLLSFSSIILL